MKKILIAALMMVGVIAAMPGAWASELSTWIDPDTGIAWTYLVISGKLSVGDGGHTSTVPTTTAGAIAIPEYIAGKRVTGVGAKAFYGCKNLTSVTIPEGVITIGAEAFYGCTSLTNVTIPASVTSIREDAFYNCSALTDVTIPEGMVSIYSEAFYRCSALMGVTLPASLKSIDKNAFAYCGNSFRFAVAEDNPTYCSVDGMLLSKDGKNLILGINGDVTIPSSVTSIGERAFYGCTALTNLAMHSSVTNIGKDAFYDCRALKSVTIPSCVRRVCSTFPSSRLTNVVICAGAKSVDAFMFADCSKLTGVTIPDGVTSIGAYAFSYCYNLTNVTIPASVTSIASGALDDTPFYKGLDDGPVVFGSVLYAYKGECPAEVSIPEGVKGICDEVFSGCSKLTSVTMPSSVTSIGEKAFYNCGALTALTIPEGVTNIGDKAFYECDRMKSVTIPGGVARVGDSVFYGCNTLTNVTISAGVKSIGSDAFYGCSALDGITIPTSVESIAGNPFAGCKLKVGFSVAEGSNAYCSIGGMLLSKDSKTLIAGINDDVTIPEGVTSIGDRAFYECDGLKSVTIPGGVVTIGSFAFYDCNSLTNVTMTSSVTSIGDCAFAWCEVLANVTMSEGLTRIGNSAFYRCDKLTSVTIPASVTTIGDRAFNECWGLKNVTMSEGVKSIGYSAFNQCGSLSNVTLPSSVTKINGGAFSSCGALTSVTIPSSMTTIDYEVFFYCYGLTNVTIPASVTSIEERAFYECSRLKNVVLEGDAPTVGENAFYWAADGCTATVNVGTTGWDDDGDGYWQGLKLVYCDNSIPELDAEATPEQIAAALQGSADEQLTMYITNATMYAAYREWGMSVKGTNGTEAAGAGVVKGSSTAWVSFALGSDKLLESAPTDEDLTVESFEPTGEAGQFEFTVSIADVNVGGGMSEDQLELLKENLKLILGVEGATSLDSGAFSPGNVDLTFGTPENGKVKLTAGAKDATATTFFMRVGIK